MRLGWVLLALLGSFLLGCGHQVRLQVVDDRGVPVAGAEAVISFTGALQHQSDEHVGKTDGAGVFAARGRSPLGVYLRSSKQGYYEARLDSTPAKQDRTQQVVLPRILNPVPLYAWDTRIGRGVAGPKFPVQNEWVGFDFEAADWVQPHGKGEVADVLFRFRHEFKGWKLSGRKLERSREVNADVSEEKFREFYGRWHAEVEIAFPHEREGIYEEPRFWPYNKMKIPHEAPKEGYQSTWRYTASTYSPPTAREDVGFFLRTRVRLDAEGNIVSANYAKVVGDFYLDARGWLSFAYYFNPRPNDRNLEFDVGRNLFPEGFPGADVIHP